MFGIIEQMYQHNQKFHTFSCACVSEQSASVKIATTIAMLLNLQPPALSEISEVNV